MNMPLPTRRLGRGLLALALLGLLAPLAAPVWAQTGEHEQWNTSLGGDTGAGDTNQGHVNAQVRLVYGHGAISSLFPASYTNVTGFWDVGSARMAEILSGRYHPIWRLLEFRYHQSDGSQGVALWMIAKDMASFSGCYWHVDNQGRRYSGEWRGNLAHSPASVLRRVTPRTASALLIRCPPGAPPPNPPIKGGWSGVPEGRP